MNRFKNVLMIFYITGNDGKVSKLPVGKPDDKDFQAGRLNQELLVLFAEFAESGNLFCPNFDDVDASRQQRKELMDMISLNFRSMR